MFTDIAAVFSEQPAIFTATVFVIGLLIGSFLNVVIYRLPLMLEREWRAQAQQVLATPVANGVTRTATVNARQLAPDAAAALTDEAGDNEPFTLVTPRSACPHCHAPIKAWQNIPVLSYLLLKGRCAACAAKISIRYPTVELATALLSAIVAWHFGFTIAAACGLWITWCLIALTGIDIDHQLLPDSITLPLMWTGLVAAVAFGASTDRPLPVSPRDAIVGAVAGYMSLWLVFHAFRLVTGKEGMGYGDFKLFGALGAWLGWKLLPLIILLSAATGAILGIAMIVLRGRDRTTPIPFGPYLAAAGWLALLNGEQLLSSYLRISGVSH